MSLLQKASASASQSKLVAGHQATDADAIARVQNEHAKDLENLKRAQAREEAAKRELMVAISVFLAPTPAEDVNQLSTQFPIVLLPVRVETVFDTSGETPKLKVRIYPDELVADSHEPPLTESEKQAGETYWTNAWSPEKEQDCWRALLVQFSSPRAAWIVRVTTPKNVDSRPDGAPDFPTDVQLRPASWTRAVEAHLLPDRWIVVAERGGAEVHRKVSSPVIEPLALTVSPNTDPLSRVDISGDGLKLDSSVEWTVDFGRAVDAGMAVTIPLDSDDVRKGFDRIIVLGLKTSLNPDDASKGLASLLEAHHYTRGLAFVPPGTPTNNTSDASSGYPPPDLGGSSSFAVERGPSLNNDESDGTRFMQALGVPTELAAHLAEAGRDDQKVASAMNDALWPVTFGYFMEQMMSPVFDPSANRVARDYFVRYVRGGGPLPVFRVGATPYGLLPVSSLSRWVSVSRDAAVEGNLANALRVLRPFWTTQIGNVPRVGFSDDPDGDLLSVLSMEASTRQVRIRHLLGPVLQWNLLNFLGLDWNAWIGVQQQLARQVLNQIGHPEWDPRIAYMTYADYAPLFGGPLVSDKPPSEIDQLSPNYIQWIRTAAISTLRDESFLQGMTAPSALFYRVLRHATLLEYSRVAYDILIKHAAVRPEDRSEREMVGVVDQHPTIWERLGQPLTVVTGHVRLEEYLSLTRMRPETADVDSYRSTLGTLQSLPTAKLERLFTETLDTCSHRLDAWVTSLVTKRLQEMRTRHPTGSYLGAYGWVEDLHPLPAEVHRFVKLEDGTTVRVQTDSGGYVHAPSTNHAAAAAVLRSGFLAYSRKDKSRYAVDLSSARVRQARWILDNVRDAQPVGAVLGYLFERGLHEGHRPLELDKYIDPFRKKYPIVADKGSDSGEPTETIAARNVVDGLALLNAYRNPTVPFWTQDLPPAGPDRDAAEAELRHLDDVVDSMADLLLAESVFQLVRGNTTGASATLDAMAQGLRPPDPEIARQPQGGTAVTHRFLVVLGGQLLSNPAWKAEPTPRAVAEPAVNGWLGVLLGDPKQIKCRVSYPDPRPGDPTRQTKEEVTAADLSLSPLDMIALAQGKIDSEGSELSQRIVDFKLTALAVDKEITIDYTRAATWGRSTVRTFPEIMEFARAIREALGGARALQPEDFLSPEHASAVQDSDRREDVALQRAADAKTALTDATTQLSQALDAVNAAPGDQPTDLTGLRNSLRKASLFGVPGALPSSALGSDVGLRDEMVARAQSVLKEMNRRLTRTAADTPVATAEPLVKVKAATQILKDVFGREFPFLPSFVLSAAQSAELGLALAAGPALLDDPNDPRKWFQQSARVRPPLARWRKMSLYSGAIGNRQEDFDVAQLPHVAGARWAALRFPTEADRPPAGRVSLALQQPSAPAANGEWLGLFIDEWTEVIPNVAENTACAFHYNNPGAEAPPAVLLAVPPGPEKSWDIETLLDILRETLELAKIRAVDLELLGALGQFLPAVYLAENPRAATVSTAFAARLVAQPTIVEGP